MVRDFITAMRAATLGDAIGAVFVLVGVPGVILAWGVILGVAG